MRHQRRFRVVRDKMNADTRNALIIITLIFGVNFCQMQGDTNERTATSRNQPTLTTEQGQ